MRHEITEKQVRMKRVKRAAFFLPLTKTRLGFFSFVIHGYMHLDKINASLSN